MIDTQELATSGALGVLATFLVPLLVRQTWRRSTRLLIAVVVTAAAAGVVTIPVFAPESWQQVTAQLTTAVAVGQVVYQALKPTGVFDWITQATNPTPTPVCCTPEASSQLVLDPHLDVYDPESPRRALTEEEDSYVEN